MAVSRAYLNGDHSVEAVADMLRRRHGIHGEAVRNDGDEHFPAWVRFTDRARVSRTLLVRRIDDAFLRHVGCCTDLSLGSMGDATAILLGILCETGGHLRVGDEPWVTVSPRAAEASVPSPYEVEGSLMGDGEGHPVGPVRGDAVEVADALSKLMGDGPRPQLN